MEAPAFVLIPPTPSRENPNSSVPSAVITHTSSPIAPEERTSSETTIFTIYSMYGDEVASRGSWSASPAVDPKDTTDNHVIPQINLSLPDNCRNSFLETNGHATSNIEHRDVNPKTPPTRAIDLTKIAVAANGSYVATRSSYAPSHSTGITLEPAEFRHASTGYAFRTIAMSSSTSEPGPSREPSQTSSSSVHFTRSQSHSQISSRKSDMSLSELPPITIVSSTPPLPSPQPENLQASLPLKHPAYTGSPSSIASLVPSEGEDMDAFHVRNTYAQLEMSGVKGDGYEEGVERTRARVGVSRASQLNAEGAIGDGKEKMRELNEKEIQTLASLDRYGFFTVPSHDRLIYLPAAPLLKRITSISAGSPSASSHAKSLTRLPPTPLPVNEYSRIAKWTRMLQPRSRDEGGNVNEWGIKPSKESKFRERTYKGIPDRWRSAAWDLMMSRFAKSGHKEMQQLGEEYREALDKPSSYDVQIDLDVPRTISGHVMFRTRYGAGQRSLFHVLHCFSLRCSDCGYVQGMGPIAATLLCYFEPERVYASLVRLHDAYSMHTIFSPGFPGLLEAIYVQERVTQQMMPAVYAAFQKHTISTVSYATKWYITLFANSVPFQTQLRLWDAFLLEGHDLFVAVAVSIIWVYRDHITASSASFETVLSLLSSFFVPEDEDSLLLWISKILGDKKLRSNMVRWRQDWKDLVTSGKDGSALL